MLPAQTPFRVPPGFEISLFAGDEMTHDTWSLAISRQGQVAVAGPGYIKILIDRDGTGTLPYYSKTNTDRPTLEAIIETLKSARHKRR